MDEFVRTISHDSVKGIEKYLDRLSKQRLQDYMLKTYGAEKGSIIHLLINTHLKDKSEVTIEKLEVILRHGAKPEQRDTYGNNAVLHAVKLGKNKLTQCLIDKCKVMPLTDSNNYGMNLFHISALHGNWSVLEKVINKIGQDKSQKLMNQKTWKVFSRYVPTLGKTVSVRSWTPLHFCSAFCHLDCVKWLVKHGVETKATNAEGLMAGEILKTFQFVKSEAIAKQCYGYIVAGTRSAKTDQDFETSQQSLSVSRAVTSKSSAVGQSSTKTEKSLDKNLAPRRDNPGQGSKIIQDLDVYLLNFGLKFKNVAKTLINSEISNLPQSSKETFEVNTQQSNAQAQDKSEKSLGQIASSPSTEKGHVRSIQDKDLNFIRNILGDYLSEHDIAYETLLQEIRARFVIRDGADSDSESYDGYYSSSFESYDSEDFEDYSTDEEDMKPPPVRSRTFIRCMDESDDDDDEIPEESNVESVEDTSRPVLSFSQRQKKTGEMVVKLDTKKAVAVYPSDATIRDIAREIPSSKLTKFGIHLGFTANDVALVEQGRSSDVKAKTLMLKWREKQVQKRLAVSKVKEHLDTVLQKLNINHPFDD